MRKTCYVLFVLFMLMCSATSVSAQVSIGIGLPHVRIGINIPFFPELVPVPGYPVYYAPNVEGNYFFYDGMYWVYMDDNWYTSYWYNGPWSLVEPDLVPLFILRIPVRYYLYPPVYFRSWWPDAPPRWGEHWGRDWEKHRKGWNKWKRGSAPPRAPLPTYQRQYSEDRYPRVEQQQIIRNQHYRYQPRDKTIRQHFQSQGEQRAPVPVQRGRQEEPRMRSQEQQPGTIPHEQQAPRPQSREQRYQDRGRSQEPKGQRPQDFQRPVPLQQGAPVLPSPQPPRQTPPQRGPAYQERRQQPEIVVPQEQRGPSPQGKEQRFQERERFQEPRGQGQGQRREEERGR